LPLPTPKAGLQPLSATQVANTVSCVEYALECNRPTSSTGIILSPLSDLHESISTTSEDDPEPRFTPQRTLPLPSVTPNQIAFALHDTRLVVAIVEGPVAVFDTLRLFSPGNDEVSPLHHFPSTTTTAVRQLWPNPGDLPGLVAIIREPTDVPAAQLVEIIDVEKLTSVGGWKKGADANATPTSCMFYPFFLWMFMHREPTCFV
jgi:nucleoporin NUP159